MRDYLIVGIVLASLPVGLFNPFYGVLVYAWLGYGYPHTYAWSFAQTFPVAKLAALSATLGLFFGKSGSTAPLLERECLAMLALLGTFTWSSLFALAPDLAWTRWQEMVKVIGMSLVAAVVLLNRRSIRLFVIVVALSLGFHGIKGGVFSLLTGGEHMIWGPGDSIIAGNTNLGLALNMTLPMLWYLAKEEQHRWTRRFFYLCFYLTIPAIMFTYSRASAMAMVVVLLVIFLQGKRRVLFLFFLLIGGLFALPLIPEQFWNRQKSTLEYQEDPSATSRLDNWEFCWQLAKDLPLTGGGFGYNIPATFAKYAPAFLTKWDNRTWDSHSIYFGILAAHGFPGLLVYLTMILFCLLSCRRISKDVSESTELRWAGSYARMIQLSFLGLLVNGAFVNMEYFDLVYHWTALTACLKVTVRSSLLQPNTSSDSNLDAPPDTARTSDHQVALLHR
jgi:probable O-glycosylation ligase (exosortase A-associated)